MEHEVLTSNTCTEVFASVQKQQYTAEGYKGKGW